MKHTQSKSNIRTTNPKIFHAKKNNRLQVKINPKTNTTGFVFLIRTFNLYFNLIPQKVRKYCTIRVKSSCSYS